MDKYIYIHLDYMFYPRSSIIYGVFAFASWISPSVVVLLGPRLSMVVAALTYAFQISQYIYYLLSSTT